MAIFTFVRWFVTCFFRTLTASIKVPSIFWNNDFWSCCNYLTQVVSYIWWWFRFNDFEFMLLAISYIINFVNKGVWPVESLFMKGSWVDQDTWIGRELKTGSSLRLGWAFELVLFPSDLVFHKYHQKVSLK